MPIREIGTRACNHQITIICKNYIKFGTITGSLDDTFLENFGLPNSEKKSIIPCWRQTTRDPRNCKISITILSNR